jgi:LAO/AO transport system kinase
MSALGRGDRQAVAQELNDAEDARPEAQARARALMQELTATGAYSRAHRVGVTGPPGVGKSSLVAAYARWLRRGPTPRSVGVVAIDPSSARSGGALLGDRIRIASGDVDSGLFVRSLSTRGATGGLSQAAASAMLILASAFDVVVVETVGVGQSETEVRELVDTLVLVVQPGAGDTLQHLKAGIMETPDVLAVSKSDTGALASRTVSELTQALGSLVHAGALEARPEVVSTSARDGVGIADLGRAIDGHRDASLSGLERARRSRAVTRAFREIVRRYGELGVERLGGRPAVLTTLEEKLVGEDALPLVLAMCPYPSP